MLIEFTCSPVDEFPEAHRLTLPRARALGRMAASPERQGLIALPLLPPSAPLNALDIKGMEAGRMAQRTGLAVDSCEAFFEGFTLGGSL
jgi:hypothetical protein